MFILGKSEKLNFRFFRLIKHVAFSQIFKILILEFYAYREGKGGGKKKNSITMIHAACPKLPVSGNK